MPVRSLLPRHTDMTDSSKPIVRLEASSAAKKDQKKSVAEAKEQTIKLAIRLNEGINEALRALIRYRGDLSTMALEALDTVDLTRAARVSAEERMVRDTTISMPRVLHKKLKKIADERGSSMNILVNTALAHWLAKKGALRLGEGSSSSVRSVHGEPVDFVGKRM